MSTTAPARSASRSPEEVAVTVEAAKRGDRDAWSWLYDTYYPKLVRYAEVKLQSRVHAEDVASDAFERILGAIDGFDSTRGSFIAWAQRITHHLIIDTYRAAQRRAEVPTPDFLTGMEEPSSDDGSEELVTLLARREWIRDRLADQPANVREVLMARHYRGLSVAETAAVLKISPVTVRGRTHRGLRAISAGIRPDDRVLVDLHQCHTRADTVAVDQAPTQPLQTQET